MTGLEIMIEPDGTFLVFCTADGRTVAVKAERIGQSFFGGSDYRKTIDDWCAEQRARAGVT